jgi:hypothetical protein
MLCVCMDELHVYAGIRSRRRTLQSSCRGRQSAFRHRNLVVGEPVFIGALRNALIWNILSTVGDVPGTIGKWNKACISPGRRG